MTDVSRTAHTRARVVAVLVATACVATGFAILPGSALADLWVSASGTDTGYCSQANPCATLARAFSLAISPDTIHVGPGTFPGRIDITTSENQLTIQGAGMHATAITEPAGQTGSVVTVDKGVTAGLDDLSVTYGTAADGGGISSDGNLTLERDFVAFNSATGPGPNAGLGGGVYEMGDGSVQVYDSEIGYNTAAYEGGGIAAYSATADRDLIASNTIVGSSGYLQGAGVWTVYGTVEADTITGNQITTSGGNTPVGDGGGIWIYEDALIQNDTIVGNHAAQFADVDQRFGTVADSIVGTGCVGDSNIVSDPLPGCSGRVVPDLGLGPLQDNGGPTPTMAITASNPAYDASSDCTGTDQRGVSYLQLGAGDCDLGAYQVSAPTTYVASKGGASVEAYATGAAGDASPVLDLSGAATGLDKPTGVLIDARGDVFVANAGDNSVTEYAPEVTGDAVPTATISGGATKLNQPQDLALDGAGHLWVTNLGGSVTEYAPGAKGNVAPLARIDGSKTKLDQPHGIVVDPNGDLRVTNGNGAVLAFAPGANGNVAPVSTLTSSALSAPRGLNFDAAGQMLVADLKAGRVDIFAPTASGAGTPLSFLNGPKGPTGLDLDLAGDVFVADTTGNAVDEFTPSGGAWSRSTISGADTDLSSPAYLSEVPPPPTPKVKASARRRVSRKRIVRDGISVALRSAGKSAFRAQPITVSAVATLKRTVVARSRTLALRPGRATLPLADTPQAARALRANRRQAITVTVTARGGFGRERRTLSVTSSG